MRPPAQHVLKVSPALINEWVVIRLQQSLTKWSFESGVSVQGYHLKHPWQWIRMTNGTDGNLWDSRWSSWLFFLIQKFSEVHKKVTFLTDFRHIQCTTESELKKSKLTVWWIQYSSTDTLFVPWVKLKLKYPNKGHPSTGRTCKLHKERPCPSQDSNQDSCPEATVLIAVTPYWLRKTKTKSFMEICS